jgi:hypothetical protein
MRFRALSAGRGGDFPMADNLEVQFLFHARGEPDTFRSYDRMQIPRVGETIVFGQRSWRVSDVTYNLDVQRVEVIAVVH